MTALRCMVLVAMAWALAAHAQVLTPTPVGSLTTPTERVWRELLKVDKTQKWEVGFRARGLLVPAPEEAIDTAPSPSPPDRDPAPAGKPRLRAVFVMPWVQASATQLSEPGSVRLKVMLNSAPVEAETVWLKSPRSMERMRAAIVTVPEGMALSFTAPPGQVNSGPVLVADLYIEFETIAGRVRLDEKMAALAEWPEESWPEDALGAMEPQVFLDSAVDPDTRLVRAIDAAPLDWIANDITLRRGVRDVRKNPPMRVIREVAAEVCSRLRMGGDGIFASSAAIQANRSFRAGQTTIDGLADVARAFEGIEVRDALTVLRSNGPANAAERATALAAVYRRLGIPARVVVGLVGEESKRDETVRRLAERERRKKGEAEKEDPRLWNPCDPEYYKKVVEPSLLKPPKFKFWVEVAVYQRDYGLGWIPIDPGKGGNSWRVGSVEGSEGIAVLATNWWPPPIRIVGMKPPPPPKVIQSISQSATVRVTVVPTPNGLAIRREYSRGGNTQQDACDPPRTHDLAAGLWGFWLEGAGARAVFQQLGADLRKGSTHARD